MKHTLLSLLLIFLLGCSNSNNEAVQMVSFKVVDQKTFEMCFNDQLEGLYTLVIKTKSGKEIKKAGPLKHSTENCFKDLKMQHGISSYKESQIKFYADSLTNENIASVKWSIARRYYEEPLAEGVYQKK